MQRRKFVIGAGALAAGASAAIGTGAFTAAELSDRDVGVTVSDDSQSLVALVAGENDYVSENDGELGIDLSNGDHGVNPNSKYQIGAIPDHENQPALKTEPLHVKSDNKEPADHAFQIQNQSPSNQGIEVELNMDECPDDATVYLFGYTEDTPDGGAEEALVEGKVSAKTEWQGLLSFTEETSGVIVGSGGVIYVSIIVEREDKNNDTDSEEWSGTMTVRAGDHDNIFDPNE